MPESGLENNDYTFRKILEDHVFEVPDYQRYYSWEKKHYQDLWKDLMNVLDGRKSGSGAEHYMGTVICREPRVGSSKNPKTVETRKGEPELIKYYVVDGQQRITSLILLVRALLEKTEELKTNGKVDDREKETIGKNWNRYIKDNRITDRQRKIFLQGRDDKTFNYILEGGEARNIRTPSQRRLRDAYEFFKEKIDERDKLEELSMVDFILDLLETIGSLNFMVYRIDSKAQATLIFESINDRGKTLSNLEKTKSFLMHKLYLTLDSKDWEDKVENVRNRFSDIYEALQRVEDSDWINNVDEDRIQRYHFISYIPKDKIGEYHEEVGNRNKTRKDAASEYLEVLKWWVDDLHSKDHDKCAEEISKYTKSLCDYYSSFEDILRMLEEEGGPEGTREAMRRLFVLGRIANLYPLILSMWNKFRENRINELEEVLNLIETSAFRTYGVGNKRSDTGRNKFYKLAYKYSNSELDLEEVKEKIVEITRDYEPDDQFKNDLAQPNFYDEITTSDIRYLFYFYDKRRKQEERSSNLDINLKKVVMKPQDGEPRYTLDHTWAQNKDKLESAGFNEEAWEESVNKLGNLTLATGRQNASWQNDPYKDKREHYADSDFRITREIADKYRTWGKEQIETRMQEIIDFALDRWGLPGLEE